MVLGGSSKRNDEQRQSHEKKDTGSLKNDTQETWNKKGIQNLQQNNIITYLLPPVANSCGKLPSLCSTGRKVRWFGISTGRH